MSWHQRHGRTALTALALLFSLASAAHAKLGTEEATNYYRATTQISRPVAAPPAAPRATTTPQSSSFPEGSPDYHGANGG
jgi:hypothetical protein